MGAHGHRRHRLEPFAPIRGHGRLGLRRAHADRAGAAASGLSPARALLAAAIAVTALTGCGGPAELSPDQAKALQSARERLDDAIDTEETCRTDRSECRHLVIEARRSSNDPKRLAKVVPSLVTPTGNVYPPAFNAFQANALVSPKLALRLPALKELQRMVNTLEGKDADTVIKPLGGQRAGAYLDEAARDTKRIWPDLSRLIKQARGQL